ncbi:hypothetical protein A3Q56_07815 [Intoshia linei]|uniref:Transmembrane protein n=1 Tax=Intoshia linei TaxID=1819745 RepID=A0A177ATB5_9BILA|nr:hypothetical protein A3Q56_07815 [Intoshia linei]
MLIGWRQIYFVTQRKSITIYDLISKSCVNFLLVMGFYKILIGYFIKIIMESDIYTNMCSLPIYSETQDNYYGTNLANYILIVGIVTPNWFVYERNGVIDTRGLFFICHYVIDAYLMNCVFDSLVESVFWYFAIRGLGVVSFVFHILTTIFISLQAFNARLKYNKNIMNWIHLFILLSATSLLVTICVFGLDTNIYNHFSISYSTGLALVTFFLDLTMLAFCLLQKYYFGTRKFSDTHNYITGNQSPLLVSISKQSNTYGGSSELATATKKNTNQNSYSVAVD